MSAGRPAAPGLPRPVRVARVARENYRTLTFELERGLEAEPGQFAMLWLPGLDEKPFSLQAAAPATFTVAAVGPFTRALHALAPGELVWLRGPFGRGFELTGDDHLLVGGGYGVAPLLFLAHRALAAGHRVRVVIGARRSDDLLLVDACRASGAEVHVCTEDGSVGVRGLVTDVTGPLVAERPPSALYACGPHGMLAALEAQAVERGVPAQLAWEAYMRCGVGLCGSCEHEGRLLCADGPVLPAGG